MGIVGLIWQSYTYNTSLSAFVGIRGELGNYRVPWAGTVNSPYLPVSILSNVRSCMCHYVYIMDVDNVKCHCWRFLEGLSTLGVLTSVCSPMTARLPMMPARSPMTKSNARWPANTSPCGCILKPPKWHVDYHTE